MFGFLKKLLGVFFHKKEKISADAVVEEQWTADFGSKEPSKLRFVPASEQSYRGGPRPPEKQNGFKNALVLELLKTNCIAWLEDTLYRYQDMAMRGTIRLDGQGYGAAGFMFRMVDEGTCYMALVSNRGYFRLDLLMNGTPRSLTGWTEIPGFKRRPGTSGENLTFDLEIIAFGQALLVRINGEWAVEINDASLSVGRVAFCAARYENKPEREMAADAAAKPAGLNENGAARPGDPALFEAQLLFFSIDSRTAETAKVYEEFSEKGPPENRVRLAETFAAMGRAGPAMAQLRRAWEDRKGRRPAGELLLGARLALALELWAEAEECIEAGLGAGPGSEAAAETGANAKIDTGAEPDAGAALPRENLFSEFQNLKAELLYMRGSYGELRNFAASILNFTDDAPAAFSPDLYILLGHAAFNEGNYAEAARAYDKAFEEGNENSQKGLAAKNAAGAYELSGDTKNALRRYLDSGGIFLEQEQYEELGLIVPKFHLFGASNWKARALIGKWAFGVENWKEAEEELQKAEELRGAGAEANPASGDFLPDPAIFYLQGLLLIRNNRRKEALPLLEEAARLAPDYPLFHFRLAENRFLLRGEAGNLSGPEQNDSDFDDDLKAALAVKREDGELYGWIHNFAAQIALNRNDTEAAALHLENAASVLGEAPAIRVNRALFFSMKDGADGLDKALALLESGPEEDGEGLMANCAGNVLFRAGRFEEATPYYQKALSTVPANDQYRYNLASCLVELGLYGEADAALTSASNPSGEISSPEILELIAFVAAKKGEWRRAEAASRAALEINPDYPPSLLHLGWRHAAAGRWDEVKKIIEHLNTLNLNEEAAGKKKELAGWMEESTTRLIACASCGKEWRVSRSAESSPPLRLFAMPPGDMPAGACPECGKVFCIGCRKEALDTTGRFTCPDCEIPLKLNDEGLKKILQSWAQENLNTQNA